MTRRRNRIGAGKQWARSRAAVMAWALLASFAGSQPGWAAKPEPPAASIEGPAAKASSKPAAASEGAVTGESAPIVYVPPSRGRARHTAGAGTRGTTVGETSGRPRVSVLAPRDHVGLTTSAHPRLYWQLSESSATRIELTVVDDDAIEPLLELSLPGPVEAGIHALDLGALGVELEPDKTYRWFVAVVHDPRRRSRDELAEGAIERIESPSATSSTGVESGPRATAELRRESLERAREGLWYDALAILEDAIEHDPSNAGLRADRASLLAQARR